MALTRTQIVDTAYAIVRDHGLAGLSMRHLASELQVQAGALYYHVASKQELLTAVAERILDGAVATPVEDPARAVGDIRTALLKVRDSAEIVSFVRAFQPQKLAPFEAVEQSIARRASRRTAERVAHTLICYVLGFVAQEQNEAELIRAEITRDRRSHTHGNAAFRFGVDLILNGLTD